MGKSVSKNKYILDDEILNKIPSTVPAAPLAEKTSSGNRYILSDEVLSTLPEIKKKDGGPVSGTTSSLTPSTSRLPAETPSDFLVRDVDQSDFYDQLIKETNKYVSSVRGTQGAPPAIPISDIEKGEVKRQTKEQILNNPTALKEYNKARVDQLNKKIKTLKEEQEGYVTKDYYGGRFSTPVITIDDKEGYNRVQKQIDETNDYIGKLKNNVAEVTGDMIASRYNVTNYNPRELGRKIVEAADPNMDDQLKMVEKSGMTLPGIRMAEIELGGIQAMENYLAKQPDSPEKRQLQYIVNLDREDFDDRNPTKAGQIAREKIGARIYKGLTYRGKDGVVREVQPGFLGLGYEPEALIAVAEDPDTQLTNGEKKAFYNYVLPIEKKLLGTDIPTSGFWRSLSNAISKSAIGTGKSIGDITGFRTEGEIAYDALNQEIEQSGFRAPGENPTAHAQLAYLNQKATKEKLTEGEQRVKKSLENYVGVRNNWSKFKDGVGDLTGQVLQIALLTKGIGGVGGLSTVAATEGGLLGGTTRAAIGQVLSNETTGLILSGYLNSYDNYKQQAIQLMPGEDQAAHRDAYAKLMATVEGASELIFRDTKILKAFTRNVAPSAREITQRLVSGEITQQVAREELQAGLQKYLKPFAKEFVKAEVSEGFEEGIVDVAQGIAESAFGGTDFDASKTGKQAINTFLTTMLYSPLVSGMAAHGTYRQNRSQNAFIKSSIVDMARDPTSYLQSVEDLQLDGTITQQEANEKIKIIKSANQYLAELPATRQVTATTPEGEVTQQVPMDYPQVSSYLLHRLNEGIIEEKLDATTDPIVETQLKKDLKRSQDIRKGIYDGTIGVTPDIQDVTDNPEQAVELGIADSNTMLPAELIGTPFTAPDAVEQSEVPRETNENQQRNEILEKAKVEIQERLDQDQIPGVFASIAQNEPEEFLNFVADQAFGRDEKGVVIEGTEAEAEVRMNYGDAIVDYAKQLFPIQEEVLAVTQAATTSIPIDQQRDQALAEVKSKSRDNINEFRESIGLPPMEVGTLGNNQIVRQTTADINSFFDQQTQTDEGQEQETAPIGEEGGEEISGPEAPPEGNESQGPEVLAEQGAESVAEAPLLEDKTTAEKGKELANRIRKLKIKQRRDIAQANIFGIGISLYNTSIDTIAYAIEQGANLATAIARGVEYIKMNRGEALDEYGYRQQVAEAANLKIKTKEELTEYLNSINEVYNTRPGAKKIYRFIDFRGAIEFSDLSAEDIKAAIRQSKISSRDKNEVEKNIAEKGKKIAQKIRELKSPRNLAQANIFGIAIGIYDGAIETVATAIEAGAALAEAINQGLQYIRDNGGENIDEEGFRQHLEDLITGKKPKVKIQVGEEQQEAEAEEGIEEPEAEENTSESIGDYKMTTSDKVGKFLSGDTWEDVFGEVPEGDQSYLVQSLSDMLQDGKNMIALAQQKWGGDVMMYGKNLFGVIQNMSNDEQLTNKKAVLLATFLGELQEAKLRSPERIDAINQLEKAVFAYYQNYMNVRGKEIVAGRLLRLYRDKYIGDVFADRILDEQQEKAKKAFEQKEQQKRIDNETVSEAVAPITEEEKTKEDKEAKKKSDEAKKKRDKKKKIKPNEAKEKAEQKLKEIEANLGTSSSKGLIGRIKDFIKKCT